MSLSSLTDRYRAHGTARVVEIDVSGTRREITQSELHALAARRAEQLTAAGVRRGHVIGIRAGNSIDWLTWDLAALAVGALLKAFPDATDVPDPEKFVAEHGLALLIADDPVPATAPAVVRPDGVPPAGAVPATAEVTDRPDLHSLVYSSGTSGRLKGLEISAAGTAYVINRFVDAFGLTGDDRHLIFLPLSNYQQRLSVYCCLWLGADLVLAPYQRVFPSVRRERPTFLIGPPVFYDTALQLYAGGKAGGTLHDFLGGHIRFLITGMAPIRRETLDGYWSRDVRLLEAYGLTETGMIAWNTEDAARPGTVGRLIDPEAVTVLDDGEVVIDRPAPLSLGYFETDGESAPEDTFRPDGSILTGDYGRLDEDGYLTLVGRKKDVIVLGTGRKVHPAEVEAAFAAVTGLAEIVVVPTPHSGRIGAIVTPADPGDPELRSSLRTRIAEVNHALDADHRVTSLVFSERPLRSDPAFMTGNLKLSRGKAAEHFAGAGEAVLVGSASGSGHGSGSGQGSANGSGRGGAR
ncbi:AMP-binding protein [Streptomyces sp. NPDC047315]|uniref:AMP-binding protein n=1 Tax=Streptomyces sp. NPDC047315 TaxID=3155142 RepID=UPI0033DC5DE0